MQNSKSQLITTVISAVILLLFLGILFLIMVIYSNRRKMAARKEKEFLLAQFEKQLMQSMIEMQDLTLNTISQEIHDNIGQMLSLVKVQLGTLLYTEKLDLQLVASMKDIISAVVAQLRDIARSLNAERIEQSIFEELVKEELQRVEKALSVRTSFVVEGEPITIPYKVKLILVRIVQESLQNIIKHANANTISIEIVFASPIITIAVRDDGKGFDVEYISRQAAGLGLQNMRSRAAVIHAGYSITSHIGEGTQTKISIDSNSWLKTAEIE